MTRFRIPPSWQLPEHAATPEDRYLNRRQVVQSLGLGALSLATGALFPRAASAQQAQQPPDGFAAPALGERYADRFPAKRNQAFDVGSDRQMTPEVIGSRYNNYYEFTTDKGRVWEVAQQYIAAGNRVDPWTVEVRGQVKRPRTIDLDAILTQFPLEERLYRFRCVERWSAQVPWTGYPLRHLIDFLEPAPSARYVRFMTMHDKKLPGVEAASWYDWPYTEALRLDEARHELAMVVVGSYGHALPMQHGAPWRVIVPWKYGYKSPKSIVGIEFTRKRPETFWNKQQPAEYGFFSNVDPYRPHPRWSQRFETDIGTRKSRKTVLYNGYVDQVESLYDGNEV